MRGKHPDLHRWREEPLNLETPARLLAASDITPVDVFYVRSHGSVPKIDPVDHRLEVVGLLDRPLTLSLDDLRERFPQRTVTATLHCAGNRRAELMAVRDIPGEIPWGDGAVGTAEWTGVSLCDVLWRAGVRQGAEHVAFLGLDELGEAEGFGGSIPLRKAVSTDVLLAWAMNGSPLLRPHGAPLRAIVPGYIGARSVKWLSQVSVQAGESANRFQAADYRIVPAGAAFRPGAGFPLGEVWLDSSIWRPRDGDTVVAGMVDIDGWALAGGEREIVRVDVSGDGGRSWVQADLLDDLGGWAWRRWRGRIELTPGRAEIVARAWDSAASVQPADAGSLWNPRGYANAACPRVLVTVT